MYIQKIRNGENLRITNNNKIKKSKNTKQRRITT